MDELSCSIACCIAPAAAATETKSRDDVVMDRLKEVLAEYHLSRFQKQVAMSWLQKMSTDSDLERIRAWFLHKMNGGRKRALKNLSPWQMGCPELLPGLRSQPVWDATDLPWIAQLEASFEIIRDELLALRGQRGFQPYRAPSWASKHKATDGVGSVSHDAGDWNVFYLFLHNMDFSENQAKAPETCRLIESIVPGQYHHAFFSALAPGTHVTKHHGPTNKKLRLHLPLVVPPREGVCRLRVADRFIEAKAGQCFVFDDSFEHEAWNNDPEQSRIVLIIDIWHPDLHQKEVKFLTYLQQAYMKAEKRLCAKEDDGDNFFSIIEKAHELGCADDDLIWS